MSERRGFFEALWKDYNNHGVRGIAKTANSVQNHSANLIKPCIQRWRGENVYEYDWDVLVILDAARVDMMKEMANQFDFISGVEEHTSTGTCSPEWMENTFTNIYREQMAKTLHITANTYSSLRLNKNEFLHLEEVWKDGWEEELGTIPAQIVTDRSIHYIREMNPERTIIHYMQPHLPFVTNNDINSNDISAPGVKGNGLNIRELHEAGYSRERLWCESLQNLRYVLENVKLLLSSIDADQVVISSDHGQALGEHGIWSHPPSTNFSVPEKLSTCIDALEKVPWCVTSASNTGEYVPEHVPGSEQSSREKETSIEEKLEALGYK